MDVLNLLFVNLREAITTRLASFLPLWAAEAVVHFGVGLILIFVGSRIASAPTAGGLGASSPLLPMASRC